MARIETKVTAASVAAAISGAIDWALSTFAFDGGAVPQGVQSLVYVVVPLIVTFAAGFAAKHTPREIQQEGQ